MVSHLRAGKHETNIRSGAPGRAHISTGRQRPQQISETRAAFEFCLAAAGPL